MSKLLITKYHNQLHEILNAGGTRMFMRFYRWSMDRLNDNSVIAFITNHSFIDSRAFDGFRKSVEDEFDYIYIVDLRSDVRANPKIAGTTHNVFGIQTGVAIMFLVKVEKELDND